MSSVPQDGQPSNPRAQVLWDRPYMPWHLIDLAEFLVAAGYGAAARDVITDAVEAGWLLESLALNGEIEPADVAGAQVALDAGWARRDRRKADRISDYEDGNDFGTGMDFPEALPIDDWANSCEVLKRASANFEPPAPPAEPDLSEVPSSKMVAELIRRGFTLDIQAPDGPSFDDPVA